MGKTVKKVVKTVTKTVENVIKNPLPVIETIALTAIGVPAPVASAVVSAANGGSIENIAKAAIASAASPTIGQMAGEAVSSATSSPILGQIAASASSSVTSAAIRGGDLSQAFVSGVVSSGVSQAYEGIKTAAADTGTMTDVSAPTIGAITPPAPTSEIDLAAGVKPAETGITPTAAVEGLKTPALQELPPAGQPIDYSNILTPAMSNLPSMGGGTGLTAPTPEGKTVQGAEPTFGQKLGEEATKAGEKLLTGAITSGLTSGMYDQKPSTSASTLTSTGLFSPTSIVPTALTGIAPVGRGKPILGGEDEEATGTWGAKTLRG